MPKLLIIEDDKILRDMYTDQFASNGYTVSTAVDGEEGLQKALQEHPDIILLDLAMPKMDGTTLIQKLRDDEWGRNAAVIILTNLSIDGELLDVIIKNRPAYCLMKIGVTPEEVMAKAEELIKHE